MRHLRIIPALSVTLTLLYDFTVAQTVEVTVTEPTSDCLDACLQAVLQVSYNDYDPLESYYGYCTSHLALTSLLVCGQMYCSEKEVEIGWKYESTDICERYGLGAITFSMEDIKALLLESIVTTVDTIEMAGTTYNGTVLPDQASFDAARKTLTIWSEETNMHHSFGWSMYILAGMMLLVGVLNRGLLAVKPSRWLGASHLASDLQPSIRSKVQTLYQMYLGTPALFGYTHMQGWLWVTVPTRLQSLFIFVYVALNVIFCAIGYNGKLFAESVYWPGELDIQLMRYVADRTGIICFYNLPLMFLFAGRKTSSSGLLGGRTPWSAAASMNLFHRWVAKVATAQVLVHSIVWAYMDRAYIVTDWQQQYWVTGTMATITMCSILPLSIEPIRRKVYEFFLATHFVLALFTIVLLFYHVKVMDGEYDIYLWVCVGVWAFERLARLLRMTLLSYEAVLTLKPNTVAHLTSRQRGWVRLDITVPFAFTPRPGEHYFIHTPKQWTFWENHPFSLASWRQVEHQQDMTNDSSGTSQKGKKNGTELSFLFAPHKGTTKRIQDQLLRSTNGSARMRLLLEGPYGSTHDLTHLTTLLFVAGGSGVTAILPYLYAIKRQPEKFAAKRVMVVWAVKNLDYATNVLQRELAPVSSDSKFQVRLHRTLEDEADITGLQITQFAEESLPEREAQVSTRTSEGETTDGGYKDLKIVALGTPSGGYELVIDRPVMSSVLREELMILEDMSSLGVLACGPAGMLDDMRQAVARSYGVGPGQMQAGRLEYIEDSFSW